MYNKCLYESIINDIAKIVKTELNKNNKFYESVLTTRQRISILKEYDIYDLLYNDLNEDFSLDSSEDIGKIKLHLGKLKKIIPDLIYRLIKVGAKESIKLIIKATKQLDMKDVFKTIDTFEDKIVVLNNNFSKFKILNNQSIIV